MKTREPATEPAPLAAVQPDGGRGLATVRPWQVATLVFVAILATGLPQPNVLGTIPFSNILKNELGKNQTQVASFFFLVTIPWFALKPVFGLISDAFPIFGTRRTHYLLLTTILSMVAWVSFAWLPHRYGPLLTACFMVNVFMAFASTVAGAVLVEAGKSLDAIGRLTAVRVVAQSVLGVLAGPIGGVLAVAGLSVMAGVNVAILASLIPATIFFVKERPGLASHNRPFRDAGSQLKTLFQSRAIWLAMTCAALFYMAPGFGTVQFFRQQNDFHLSNQTIGLLTGIAAGGSVIVAAAYPLLSKRFTTRRMLISAVLLSAAGNFLYLAYSASVGRDALIDLQSALSFMLFDLVFYNIAARATPSGSEAMAYALLGGFRNFCVLQGNVLGAALINHKFQFWQLITANSATTLCVLIVLPFLPASIMQARDRTANLRRDRQTAAAT